MEKFDSSWIIVTVDNKGRCSFSYRKWHPKYWFHLLTKLYYRIFNTRPIVELIWDKERNEWIIADKIIYTCGVGATKKEALIDFCEVVLEYTDLSSSDLEDGRYIKV